MFKFNLELAQALASECADTQVAFLRSLDGNDSDMLLNIYFN